MKLYHTVNFFPRETGRGSCIVASFLYLIWSNSFHFLYFLVQGVKVNINGKQTSRSTVLQKWFTYWSLFSNQSCLSQEMFSSGKTYWTLKISTVYSILLFMWRLQITRGVLCHFLPPPPPTLTRLDLKMIWFSLYPKKSLY